LEMTWYIATSGQQPAVRTLVALQGAPVQMGMIPKVGTGFRISSCPNRRF
jgi:hypothetical protein